MIAAFIPKNLYVETHKNSPYKGRRRKVLFVNILGIWPDGSIGIDQYYYPNFAKFERISQEELETIPGYKETGTEKAVELYRKIVKDFKELKRFEVGKTYRTRSICDHNCIFSWTIISRTEKRLKLLEDTGEITTRGIYIYDGVECCKPDGTYSMCPIIRADKIIEEKNTDPKAQEIIKNLYAVK